MRTVAGLVLLAVAVGLVLVSARACVVDDFAAHCTPAGGHVYERGAKTLLCLTPDGRIIEVAS